MKFNRQKIMNELRRAGVLVFCNLVLAFLVNAFIIPHDIIVGGATGVGILVSKLLPLDTATVVLIFNILMLILGGVVLAAIGAWAGSQIDTGLLRKLFGVFLLFVGISELRTKGR